MTSLQEQLRLKREPLDKWSVREQLCLASAVARSGDQNWMSVSRSLKPFGDPNRPLDWFHQKNCAAQYGALLGNVETPKRKKRSSTGEVGFETPSESILRRLIAERQNELKKLLAEEKAEYHKLQENMIVLQTGKVTEDQLDKWCKEIDEEEARKYQESLTHTQWLKEREHKKLEIERAWRPIKPNTPGQKRKISDAVEMEIEEEAIPAQIVTQQEPGRPALSPLLTSLLKSPSQVQNVQTTSILHSAITNTKVAQKHLPNISTNSTIASLLNSSTGVTTVSPGLEQLVTTAIGNEDQLLESHPLGNDILDDPNLPHLKIDDLANSILDGQDGPLPEIKKEEVDDIISEIIENAHDMMSDPEHHLVLDGNGDININLDFDDEPELTPPPLEERIFKTPSPVVPPPIVEKLESPKMELPKSVAPDPFEFQEDPIIFEPAKPIKQTESKLYQQQPTPKPQSHSFSSEIKTDIKIESPESSQTLEEKIEIKEDVIITPKKVEKNSGSVEIVDVDAGSENSDIDKTLNKSQIQDIVHFAAKEPELPIKEEIKIESEEETKETKSEVTENIENSKEPVVITEESSEASDLETISEIRPESIKNEPKSTEETSGKEELVQEIYDEIAMEIKVDKTGKVKRDYSRMKKKEEKEFDMLLAIEKSQLDSDIPEETLSDKDSIEEKKEIKPIPKVEQKIETERSNSPWTEEDVLNIRNSRRYSTPATPLDSVPNSPASSINFDDDRDYKNWKKSVMLVYNRLATNKYASLFLKPITDEHAPDYSKMIYRPMDLQTIKKNIETGVLRNSLEFKRDIMLMFTNAIMYNKMNDTVYNMAQQMQLESLQPIEILLQATMQVDAPLLRRETRTSESGSKRKRTTTDEFIIKAKKRKED